MKAFTHLNIYHWFIYLVIGAFALHVNAADRFDKYGMGTAYKLSNKDSATWNEASALVAVKSHTLKDGDWDEAMRNLKVKCGILDDIVSMCQKRNILMVSTACVRIRPWQILVPAASVCQTIGGLFRPSWAMW